MLPTKSYQKNQRERDQRLQRKYNVSDLVKIQICWIRIETYLSNPANCQALQIHVTEKCKAVDKNSCFLMKLLITLSLTTIDLPSRNLSRKCLVNVPYAMDCTLVQTHGKSGKLVAKTGLKQFKVMMRTTVEQPAYLKIWNLSQITIIRFVEHPICGSTSKGKIVILSQPTRGMGTVSIGT